MIESREMALHEIVLPETKPETEWVDGRALQKMSPTYDHARVQALLAAALSDWADEGKYGRVGTEWRFRIAPPREIVRPLVPDVAFLSYASMPRETPRTDVQIPLAAPTVAIEILSPDDRPRDVAHKIETYLAAGTSAIFVFDPREATVAIFDGAPVRTLREGEMLEHSALPGFALDLAAFFARARR